MNYGLKTQAQYLQIAEILRKEILVKSPGDRMDSDNVLARKFSVSTSVIREALSILTRDGLVTRHVGKGTFVSADTRQKHVALLLDTDCTHSRSSLQFLVILREIRSLMDAREIPYRVYLGNQNPVEIQPYLSATSLLDDVKIGSVSAVLSIFSVPHPEWTSVLQDYRVPILGLSDYFPEGVTRSRQQVMASALDCLTGHGAREIALMSWVSDRSLATNVSYIDAFRQEMQARGLRVREEWLKYRQHPSIPGVGWEHFRDIWTASEEKPDGLIVTDDILFQDAALAIVESGVRVPEELKVVAMVVDAPPILFPFDITCLEYSTKEVAENMIALLDRRLAEPEVSPLQVISNHRVIESSRFYQPTSEFQK